MHLDDSRTGELIYGPTEAEGDTLRALSGIFDEILKDAFMGFVRADYRDGSGRSSRAVVEATAVLSRVRDSGRLSRESDASSDARITPHPYYDEPGFDCYTAANAADWPRSSAELRAHTGLLEAGLDALAASLNAELRREAADTLAQCADFARKDGRTAWDSFRANSELRGATLAEVVDAIASGSPRWTARCDWTPSGGALGDPFTVCTYSWGSRQFAAKLDPHELVQRHLAGDAALILYRAILDYGDGPQEVIWPHQQFNCCGRSHRLCDEQRWPCRPRRRWDYHSFDILSAATQCPACGAISRGSWLTFRPLESAGGPLAQVERLDALPPETLAATADGLLGVKPGDPIV